MDALVLSRRRETRRIDPLQAYLLGCSGGSDILEFRTNDEVRGAATAIRSRSTAVAVEVRYNKVFLKIRI